MKIKTSDLLPAVKSLLPIAGGRNTIPVLNCFLIAAKGGRMTISASDIDQYCEWFVDCEGDLDACCVNANHFATLAQAAGGEIEITKDLLSLKVVGFGRAVLPLLDAEEFIKRPADKAEAIAVNCSELKDSIGAVDFAAIKPNAGRFILEHVFVIATTGKLVTFATDGRQLAKCEKSLIGVPCEFGIHKNRVLAFKEWLGFEGSNLLKCDRFVSVKADCGQWFGMLSSDCNTPDYARTIAGCQMHLGTLPSEELVNCVSAARSLVRANQAGAHPVWFKFEKSRLTVLNEVFSHHIEGKFEPYQCKFDSDLLLPLLGRLKDATITLKYDRNLIIQWSDQKTDAYLCEMKG